MQGRISVRALVLWEAAAVIAGALLVAGILWLLTPRTILWYGSLWLIGLCFVAAAFGYLPLLYYSCGYRLAGGYLEYRGGVIFYTRQRMLRRSVMYITVVRTPLSPLLGTRTVVVHSMGGSLAIPFLPLADAARIQREFTPK